MPRWRCAGCGNIIAGVEPGTCSVCGHTRFGANRSRPRPTPTPHAIDLELDSDGHPDRGAGDGARHGTGVIPPALLPAGRLVGAAMVLVGVAAWIGWVGFPTGPFGPAMDRIGHLLLLATGGLLLLVTR